MQIPYFPAIYNRSGYPEFVAAQAARGANYAAAAVAGCSYQLSSRAKVGGGGARWCVHALARGVGWGMEGMGMCFCGVSI